MTWKIRFNNNTPATKQIAFTCQYEDGRNVNYPKPKINADEDVNNTDSKPKITDNDDDNKQNEINQ